MRKIIPLEEIKGMNLFNPERIKIKLFCDDLTKKKLDPTNKESMGTRRSV